MNNNGLQLIDRKGFLIETKRVSDEAVELYNPTIIPFLRQQPSPMAAFDGYQSQGKNKWQFSVGAPFSTKRDIYECKL